MTEAMFTSYFSDCNYKRPNGGKTFMLYFEVCSIRNFDNISYLVANVCESIITGSLLYVFIKSNINTNRIQLI